MFLLQAWFNLPDEGIEYAIYAGYVMRTFMDMDFNEEQFPDPTMLCKFRKPPANIIGKIFFESITRALEEHGHIMRCGTIVDATIIEAPSPTKNRGGSRDNEMRRAKKGNQWHFGMKVHARVA
jgi:IS5 family transposase